MLLFDTNNSSTQTLHRFLLFFRFWYSTGSRLTEILLTYLGVASSQAKRQIFITSAIISRMKFLRLDSKFILNNFEVHYLLIILLKQKAGEMSQYCAILYSRVTRGQIMKWDWLTRSRQQDLVKTLSYLVE